MADIRLIVNGIAYGGWKRASVSGGLDELAGTFDLGVSEVWPGNDAAREIAAGDECRVEIAGETVITGYVDAAGPNYDATSHGYSVRGRDKTADLVDCAAPVGKGEWRNATFEQIARDLCAPFGIEVVVHGSTGAPFPTFAREPGETNHATLERAADLRGLRLTTDGLGRLVVGVEAAAAAGVRLVEGENLLSASKMTDESQRFSQYTVLGQQAGNDDNWGKAASQVKAIAKDAGVRRFRPLEIVAEDQGDSAALQRRADWEASTRAARALTVNARMQGWTYGAGKPWRKNMRVPVYAPALRLDRELLVSAVNFTADEGGSFTDLTLMPPEAFTAKPVTAKPDDKASRKGKGKAKPRKKRKAQAGVEAVFNG